MATPWYSVGDTCCVGDSRAMLDKLLFWSRIKTFGNHRISQNDQSSLNSLEMAEKLTGQMLQSIR